MVYLLMGHIDISNLCETVVVPVAREPSGTLVACTEIPRPSGNDFRGPKLHVHEGKWMPQEASLLYNFAGETLAAATASARNSQNNDNEIDQQSQKCRPQISKI